MSELPRFQEHELARVRRARERQQEVIDLVSDLGMYRSEELLNVHRTTIQRWMRGESRVPDSAIYALRGVTKGQLPGQSDTTWQGWIFGKDGNLYDPTGRPFHVGDLMAQQYERQLIKAQQARIRELEAKLARAEAYAARFDPAANQKLA